MAAATRRSPHHHPVRDRGQDLAQDPPVPTGPGLADVVQGIFRTTSETALPIDINGLDVDNTSEVPTLYDNLLI